ncbi:hypothetical protein RHSIM_Rhsim02G0196200 [Rhododendron simsii]|uniref:General transcription and DNA repair factor IIH subunit TFB5 n=1 Tax=Rhododendron simsii TaxID=118357 RepID=A0A834LV90_RHOSS|nr:hypothetical protein RHSIM_Rhsim02G0196200 [Rhododendron simsii]
MLQVTLRSCFCVMVNAIKGLLISCDIPMAQFIINLDNSLPPSQKFIIHILDSTHLFVQPHVSEMIRSSKGTLQEKHLKNKTKLVIGPVVSEQGRQYAAKKDKINPFLAQCICITYTEETITDSKD